MRWIYCLRWTALIVILFVAAVARGEEDAKSCYEKGLSAFALADYTTAATWYEKAFALKPDPALLYNAAQSHRLAGDKQRALVLYRNYLRVFAREIKNGDEVRRHIAELERAIRSDEKAARSQPVTPAPVRGEGVARKAIAQPEAESPPPVSVMVSPARPTPPPTPQRALALTQVPASAQEIAPESPSKSSDEKIVARELTERPTGTQPESLVKKPWFWGVIAGAVGALALGVGLGVGLGTQSNGPAVTFGTAEVR